MSDSSTQQPQGDARLAALADSEYTPADAPASVASIAPAQPTTQTAEQSGGDADGTGFWADGYTPAFNPTVRTVVYILGLVASIVSAGFIAFGNPDVGAFIGSAAALVASALGTAYNPISVAKRSQIAALTGTAQPKHAA